MGLEEEWENAQLNLPVNNADHFCTYTYTTRYIFTEMFLSAQLMKALCAKMQAAFFSCVRFTPHHTYLHGAFFHTILNIGVSLHSRRLTEGGVARGLLLFKSRLEVPIGRCWYFGVLNICCIFLPIFL